MWIHEGFTTYTESVFIECLKAMKKLKNISMDNLEV